MNYFQIGNLSAPTVWIAAVSALLIASILNRVFTGIKTSDWFWNGFFLYFLIWKLSYIVFHLKMFLDMPLSIVYFNGGLNGHIMGLVVLSVYLVMFAFKKSPSIYKESYRLFLLYFMCYEVIMNALEKNYIEALGHLVILVSFLFYLLYSKKNENLVSGRVFILFFLIDLLMISVFQTIVSIEVLTFIWIGLTIFILSKKISKEARSIE